MQITPLLKSSGLKSVSLAALAITLGSACLPSDVLAQDRPRRGQWTGGERGDGPVRTSRAERSSSDEQTSRNRGLWQDEGRIAREGAAPLAGPPRREAPPAVATPARSERQEPRGPARIESVPVPASTARPAGIGPASESRNDPARRDANVWSDQRDRNDAQTARPHDSNARADRKRREASNPVMTDGRRRIDTPPANTRNDSGDRDWRDTERHRDDHNWRDDRNRRDDRSWGNDRNWRDERNRRDYRDHRGVERYWDRWQWRNDRRYNWQDYRRYNRSLFSPGYYYAPYRDYRYRRLSIGFYLDWLFFSSRYWIHDPWQYRLPAVWGPYRWVRYYDDVLLVDTYTGEVVDVIYDFFW